MRIETSSFVDVDTTIERSSLVIVDTTDVDATDVDTIIEISSLVFVAMTVVDTAIEIYFLFIVDMKIKTSKTPHQME